MKPKPKIVRCANCKRFLFSFVVTTETPVIGTLGEVRDLKCGNCGLVSMVQLGICDKDADGSREMVQKRLEEMVKEGL